MPIYQIKDQKISSLKEKDFPKEKEMHDLIEANLDELFGLQLIDGEFLIEGYFLDSLAYDPEVNSFVILEYKKSSNYSIVDQGLHYLSLMLNNKANFVLAYITKTNKKVIIEDFDWSQVRVVFVAKSFTQYQHGATNFKDFPIELWEFNRYENGLLDVRQIQSSKKAESITKIVKSSDTERITREIKTFTVEHFFKPGWTDSKEIYEEIKEKILALDGNLVEDFRKPYIGYKIGRLNVLCIESHKERIVMVLLRTELKDLMDPEKKATYRKNSYKFFNQHQCEVSISNPKDVDYAVYLAKQVVERFIKNH